jgi:DNA-binding SARP family transcriptional activator
MVPLTIRLFGRFDVCRGDQPSDVLNARRAREVFSYLVLHRNQPQRRETLADILWEDAPPEQSRKYLRQALWQIQTALRPHSDGNGAQLLGVDPEWIQLNSCDQLNVDVSRFKEAISSCHGISGPKLSDVDRQCLEEAVDLYRGDLLEGWCQDWCLFERERLQSDFLDALEKLVCSCEARCDSERGLAHAKRMLAVDPAREQVHRHIMRLHLLAGNRTEALREFQRCERVLMEELGVKPSQQTRALYESIRAGAIDSPWPDLHAISIAAESPRFRYDQLPALADLLSSVQHLFAGIETRLRQDIAAADAPRGEPE